MSKSETESQTFLVQRSWVTVTQGADGKLHRLGHATNDRFTDVLSAAAHYKRALEGRWVEPSWQDWAVTADREVIALADCDEPAVPMPDHIRAALAKLSTRMSDGLG